MDQEATKQSIKENISGKTYVHLACHGSFAWGKDPLGSEISLTNDEPLTLAEIIPLQLENSRLVTLSACETGIVDISQSPDEYVGLPAGFLWAGAAGVVSSLWLVNDRSNNFLMNCFYQNLLKKNMSLPEALQEAQLWLRDATRKDIVEYLKSFIPKHGEPTMLEIETGKVAAKQAAEILAGGRPDEKPYAHPFYWAAFTLTGS